MLRKQGHGGWLCGLLMGNDRRYHSPPWVKPPNNGHKPRAVPIFLDLSHWYNYLNRTLRYLVRNISNYYQASQAVLVVKKLPASAGGTRGSSPSSGGCPQRRKWSPTPGFLPGKSLGQRSLAGYSP